MIFMTLQYLVGFFWSLISMISNTVVLRCFLGSYLVGESRLNVQTEPHGRKLFAIRILHGHL